MPRTTTQNPVDDPQITLRLKHGIHTIFLFVMLDWTFRQVSAELLAILHERYPDGLTTCVLPSKITPVPKDGDVKIVYGVPRNANDLSKGWKVLQKQDNEDTVFEARLRDLAPVAFTLVSGDVLEENVVFDVDTPTIEEEEL
ncbi:hypothetical protein B0H66DRAFT_820 [Apodospora peruviana]|uniref:Uncharacterized protein n=1 Tax=Apodospora peruviana TaxID=516989 RepID=A0AAE0MF42_9PEZI|nr:hypothetical protein B0H66DRAFT_820 [Apodospora peruviana]